MRKEQRKKAFRAAFPRTLPILAGYLVLGFGYGLLLQSRGYNFIWAFFTSTFVFAGSLQYVMVDLLASGASLISTAALSLMINARHLFYGLSMLVRYRDMRRCKPYLIFGMTDETYSLVCSTDPPEDVDTNTYYLFITLLDHCYWVAGSVLGSVFGAVVPINTTGVDFAMTSLFIVILVDNLKKPASRLPAVIGLVVSFVCLLIFGADNFLIPSMLAIAAALLLLRPVLTRKEAANG